MTAPAFSADDTAVQPPAKAPQLSDADYWDQLVAQKVEPHEATARVLARRGMPADSIWDQLTAQGAVPDSATAIVSRVTGAQPAENLEKEKADFIAKHPLLDKFMGFGQGLARGVSFGATKNFEGPDEQGVANRNKGLVTTGQIVGTVASPLTKAIGAASEALLPNAGAVTSGAAQGVAAGALQGGLEPAGSLSDRLKNAGIQGTAGAVLGGGAGFLAGRARAPLVDKTIKSETNAAYQGMREGAPVTDPGFLAKANEFAQTPEGQAAYQRGQQIVFNNSGRRVPDLPEPTPKDIKSLMAAKLAGKPTPPATSITSMTPEQVDAWKQGAHDLDMDGAFRPLLTQADQLIPGYQSARGLYEAGIQPSPNLADAAPAAIKLGSIVAGAASHNPAAAIPGLLLSSYLKTAGRKPLSEAAKAALKGVQQQVGDLPLSQLLQQGGALPAALTGVAHMAPYLSPNLTGVGSSATPQNSDQ